MAIPPTSAGNQMAFFPSLVIPQTGILHLWIGLNPSPQPVVVPFVSQPANSHLLRNPTAGPVFAGVTSRFSTTTGSVADAGAEFRGARITLQSAADEGHDVGQFVAAAVGEALWYEGADSSTYRALDRVHKLAQDTSDRRLHLQERLVRSVLMQRTGADPDTTWEVLTGITGPLYSEWIEPSAHSGTANLDDQTERVFFIQALVSALDLSLQEAIRAKGAQRKKSFLNAMRILDKMTTVVIGEDNTPADSKITENPLEVQLAAELYAYTATLLLQEGLPEWALGVAGDIFEFYPDTDAARRLVADGSPFKPFIVDGRLKTPEEVSPTLTSCVGAALREGLARAVFQSNGDALAYMTIGALMSMGYTSAMGGGPDFPAALQAAGTGAALMYGVGRTLIGASAEETRQAWQTGHSNQPMVRGALSQVAKLAATYLFFGGAAPGIGAMENVPVLGALVAHADGAVGQLHGLGSITAGLYVPAVHHGGDLISQVASNGFAEGVQRFWHGFSETTVFGSSVQAGANFWGRGGFRGDVSHLYRVGDLWSLWRAASVVWAGATMVSSGLREAALNRFPNALTVMELAMLPGMYDFAVDLGTALDVELHHAQRIAAIGMGMQILYHTMSGGERRSLDFSNIGRGAIVEQLFAGAGGQMKAKVEGHGFAGLFANSMGIQVGLVPVMVAHGLLLKWNLWRTGENKVLRSFSAETMGNTLRLMLGWPTWQGTLASGLMQAFVQCPWMSRVAQEPVASGPQRGALLSVLKPLEREEGEGDGSYSKRLRVEALRLRKQATVAGRRWRFLMPLTGSTLVEHLPMFLAYFYAFKKMPEPFGTKPEEFYYRMLYNTLMEGSGRGFSQESVAELLTFMDIITEDLKPEFRDVAHNLLVSIWAARHGPNGEAIRGYFSGNSWLFDHFGISREEMDVPREGLVREVRWFRRHLIGSVG